VINGMFAAAQNITAVAAMSVAQHSRAPVTRGHMRDRQIAMTIAAPPIEFDHVAKPKVRHKIEYLPRHNDSWSRATISLRVLHQSTQRRPMKMIEVRVRNQNEINGRKIWDLDPGLPQSLKHKQPAGEVRINDYVLAAHLKEKSCMTDERQPHVAIGH